VRPPVPDTIRRCCFGERGILAGSGDASEAMAGFMAIMMLPVFFCFKKGRDLPDNPAGLCCGQVAY
jgi:hypothetical protein